MPYLLRGGCRIAYTKTPALWGRHADVVYLPGMASTMHGEKARELQLFATRQLGCNYWALEYQGHGDSTPNFEECTLTTWLDDVLQLLDTIGSPRQFLVGSSMGAWLALHAALRRPHLVQVGKQLRVHSAANTGGTRHSAATGVGSAVLTRLLPNLHHQAMSAPSLPHTSAKEKGSTSGLGNTMLGLLLLAPAVDISQHWQAVAQPAGVDAAGHELVMLPSAYVEAGGIRVRRQLLEEASAHHLLLHTGQLEALTCPATIMHSIRDDVVPLELVQRLADELQRSSRAFHLELLPDGNHRLSRESDLRLMCRLLGQLVQQTLEGMALT